MVLAGDFRHPAVLARELASIDLLSAGAWRSGWAPATTRWTTAVPAFATTLRGCASTE